MPITQETIYQIIDQLRSISTIGINYAKTEYDRERYQKIQNIAIDLLASIEERPFEGIKHEFMEGNFYHVSPVVGAEAVIVRKENILLVKRRDNGLWAVPGGLVEVGETLAEAAERELYEETGIQGQASKLLGIFDSRIWNSKSKIHLYHVVFLVEASDINPRTSIETTEIAFFSENNLPDLTPGHVQRVPILFKILHGEIPAPFFDKPNKK